MLGDDGPGWIEGYANVKNVIDSYNDKCVDGCYTGLDELVGKGWMASQHEWGGEPIGTISEAREDDRGLFVKMAFHSTQKAQDIRTICKERMERGHEVAFSIGYFTQKARYEVENGNDVRILEKIKVFEVSYVSMPANDKSLATSVKGVSPGSKFCDQIANALELVSDISARAEDISSLRKKGLSDSRAVELKTLASEMIAAGTKLSGALTEPAPACIDPVEEWDISRRISQIA